MAESKVMTTKRAQLHKEVSGNGKICLQFLLAAATEPSKSLRERDFPRVEVLRFGERFAIKRSDVLECEPVIDSVVQHHGLEPC